MRHTVLLAVVLLTACEPRVADRMMNYCQPNTPGRAEFIVACATAANPKSDEEGEDLVAQCERTSQTLFCPLVPHRYDGGLWRPVTVEPSTPEQGGGK